jgi:protocatechuate 3,4-dioxygenase beta subunit
MNHQKSNYTKGQVPKDENMTVSEQGDQLQVTIVGTDDDGTPIAISYVIPVSGGTGQMQQGGSYNGVSAKRVNDSTRDTTYTKDGDQVTAEHMVVATDGKTMTVTVKGVDSNGKPVAGVLVFDKEQ